MSSQLNYFNQNIMYNPLFRNSLNSNNSIGTNNNINLFNNFNNINYNIMMNNINRTTNNYQLNNNNPYFINYNQTNYLNNRIRYYNEEYVSSSPLISKEQTNNIINQLNTCVCKIYALNDENATGTGFFCRIPFSYCTFLPVLMTNNHVLNEEDIKANRVVKFSLKDEQIKKQIIINESRITFTNKDLDVTIIQIIPYLDGINDFLQVDETIDKLNMKEKIKNAIYILQYPKGKSYYSYGDIKDNPKAQEIDITYSCTTFKGSSGAPILNLIDNKVIGVHKGNEGNEGTPNIGTLMKYIVDAFRHTYNTNKAKFKFLEKDQESKIKYFTNKEYYVGHLAKGKVTIYYANGKIKYEGDCLDDKFEGKGTYYYKGGNRYEGEWKNGLKDGRGILYYDHQATKKKYEGHFTKGKFGGKGTYFWPDGSYYKGDFINCIKHGYGEYYYKDGSLKYKGNFANDKYGGKGVYYCENGDYYVGDFMNGLKHGQGILYNKNGGVIFKGKFVNNKYQGKQ